MRTDLESGAWIEHRPIQELKGKDRDAIMRSGRFAFSLPAQLDQAGIQAAVAEAASNVGPHEFGITYRNATWGRVLTAWSFTGDDGAPLPLPATENDGHVVNAGSIGELPLDDFAALEDLFAPYVAKLLRQPDPKGSPSGTTSSSNGSPRARATGSPKG